MKSKFVAILSLVKNLRQLPDKLMAQLVIWAIINCGRARVPETYSPRVTPRFAAFIGFSMIVAALLIFRFSPGFSDLFQRLWALILFRPEALPTMLLDRRARTQAILV